jgi:hypothetical protein
MLEEHQMKQITATPETVDGFPDNTDDLAGNPINPDQHMTMGKYKASSLTMWGCTRRTKAMSSGVGVTSTRTLMP